MRKIVISKLVYNLFVNFVLKAIPFTYKCFMFILDGRVQPHCFFIYSAVYGHIGSF